MLARIAHDIGHPCLPPAVIDFLVTGFAGGRADEMGLDCVSRRRAIVGAGRGCRRQVAEERHDLPNLLFRQIPGRHRRVADAVIDVSENLTVGQRGKRLAKGWRARIDMLANGCAAAPVKAVADRAFLLKHCSAGGDIRFVGLQRTGARGRFRRHAVQEQPGRDFRFNRGRRRTGARQAGERETIQERRKFPQRAGRELQ